MIGLSVLNELGLDTPTAAPEQHQDQTDPTMYEAPALVHGSPTAQALLRVWKGEPGTMIVSGPGGGKTKAIVDIVAHLVMRAELDMVVATPTKEQAYGVALRLHMELPKGYMEVNVNGLEPGRQLPVEVAEAKVERTRKRKGQVVIRTLDSCRMSPPPCDVMVVDEGYQATFSQIASAAAKAKQLLVVGDSGQIGPVVSIDVRPFIKWGVKPHMRAPEVLVNRPDFEQYNLTVSYRLGAESVAAIQPFYDFELTSGRPQRTLTVDGAVQDELTSITVQGVTDHNDHKLMTVVADRAAALVGGVRHDADTSNDTVLTEQNIAVVVSRNTQITLIQGMLKSRGVEGVVVGTANKLQGGQFSAVVALDPLTGVAAPRDRDASNELVCVMASRHTTHLTWVCDDRWVETLAAVETLEDAAKQKALNVRKALTVRRLEQA